MATTKTKATIESAPAAPIEAVKNGVETALVTAFKAARRVSTPLVAVETPDPASTISVLGATLPPQTPVFSWDVTRGMVGTNAAGKAAAATLGIDAGATVNNCPEALVTCEKLPTLSVVFMYNLHRQLGDIAVVQGLWNLRDAYKLNKRMIVGLGPSFKLPAELQGDVTVLDEPLPTREELSATLDQQHKNADLPLPTDDVRAAALDALVGLSNFTAEQTAAMSLTKAGVNLDRLWERKIKAIQQTEGLSVYKPRPGDTTIAELKGIDNVVQFATELIAADAFNLIVFLDEMDKSFAGGMSEHTGDSGVGKDQVGQLLTYMNDEKSLGMMLAGIAGTGKTQLAKAMGAASGKPVILLDLGGAKDIHVGGSEAKIRTILKVITATAEGRVLFVGTANRTTIFTPELNRRFRKQFFFDLPSADARKAIWTVYAKKNGLTASQSAIPDGFDEGWTGAEIQAACEEAAMFGKSVVQAARFIIPQAVSAKTTIAQMRRESVGRFLSASDEGFYQIPTEGIEPVVAARTQRQIEVG